MDKKQEPSLGKTSVPDDMIDKVEDNIDKEIQKEKKQKEKKKNWFKKKIDKIDQYLYEIEVIFSTSSDMKLKKKSRNVYILKSTFLFSFFFIVSYTSFYGYYYVVNEINKVQVERVNEIEASGGIPIIFYDENIKTQN